MRRCGNAEDFKKTQKTRKTNAPQRLPRRRPRALTFPTAPDKSTRSWNPFRKSVSQQTSDQSQSILLAWLPAEVRQLIWAEVLGGHLLHIVRARKRLLAISCAENVGPNLETRWHGCWGHASDPISMGTTPGFYLPRSKHPAEPAKLLPLVQTCRRIYKETISMLYADNIFDINHLDTIIYLQKSVLPQRLDQMCALNLTWNFRYSTPSSPAPYDIGTWRETCDILASFTGLQELTIHLTGNELTPGAYLKSRRGPLLQAFAHIKVTKRFDVFLPWSEEECMAVAKECSYPFRLISKIEVPLAPEESNNGFIEL